MNYLIPIIFTLGILGVLKLYASKKSDVKINFANVVKHKNLVMKYWRSPIPFIEPVDFLTIIALESDGDHTVIGKKGERGLMQVMQETFAEMKAKKNLNFEFEDMSVIPEYGVKVGMDYIYDEIIPKLRRNVTLKAIIMSYNGGITRFLNKGEDGMPTSVKNYWNKFLQYKSKLMGIV